MKAVKVRGALEPALGDCRISVGRSAVLEAVAVPVHLQGCRHGSKAVEESSDQLCWNISKPFVVYIDRTGWIYLTTRRGEMNRIGSLALIIGLAVLIVVGLACGAEEKQDPAKQVQGQLGPSGSPVEDTSPVVPAGSPVASLIHEGAIHYADSLGREDPRFNEDDLELLGVSKSNRLVPGSAAGWDIYKLKGGEEGYIFTFSPGQSFLNEDGRTITTEPQWVLWIAAGSTPLFFCTPTPPAAC